MSPLCRLERVPDLSRHQLPDRFRHLLRATDHKAHKQASSTEEKMENSKKSPLAEKTFNEISKQKAIISKDLTDVKFNEMHTSNIRPERQRGLVELLIVYIPGYQSDLWSRRGRLLQTGTATAPMLNLHDNLGADASLQRNACQANHSHVTFCKLCIEASAVVVAGTMDDIFGDSSNCASASYSCRNERSLLFQPFVPQTSLLHCQSPNSNIYQSPNSNIYHFNVSDSPGIYVLFHSC